MVTMNPKYKILSILLSYPTEEIQNNIMEVEHHLVENALFDPFVTETLLAVVREIRKQDLINLQEQYMDIFDNVKITSLYLFQHVYGDSRDRGQAMVDLRRQYSKEGLHSDTRELPDYLPLFLEYLALLPEKKAAQELAATINIIGMIGQKLREHKSYYHSCFTALESLSLWPANQQIIEKAIKRNKSVTTHCDQEIRNRSLR